MNTSKYVCLFYYYVLGLAIILASTSCQSDKKNSVFILAFDQLPSDAVTCSDDRNTDSLIENSGFAILCKESIRFTHSYTTSLQPAAAMGSLLSAEYPFQNKLHRSFDRISDQTQLVTELAFENNFRTAFFSGSPNILKKTGLSKYFELFDDSSAVAEKKMFKEFKTQTDQFFEWYFEDPKPFFAVIYNSELQLAGLDHTNALEKLDENLAGLFKKLKNENLWETTTILLVGLNGTNKFQRLNETDFQNLHSENTQIATLIKLPRAQGDEGVNWKNDTVIQLADMGLFLKRIISGPEFKTTPKNNYGFPLIDIAHLISEKKSTISNTKLPLAWQRQVLIEAPNTWARDLTWIQFAVLQNQDLFIDLNEPAVFNILTDGMETTNLYQQKQQIFKKTQMNLLALKAELNLKNVPLRKNKKIFSTDPLLNTNIHLENIWGLLHIN